MEIAMVLESWGHTIGLVLVMDTPRPEQIRPLQPHAVAADEGDVMELVEMVLGALGSDALGLGQGMAHPARSEEWMRLSNEERMEFFAPIWRIMRDENMTAAQACSAAHACFADQDALSGKHAGLYKAHELVHVRRCLASMRIAQPFRLWQQTLLRRCGGWSVLGRML